MQKYRLIFLMLSIAVLAAGLLWAQNIHGQVGLHRIQPQLNFNTRHLQAIAQHLRKYQEKTEHYPTNDQGLLAVESLVRDCSKEPLHAYSSKIYYLRASKNGIITVWGEPFIYENRRGLPSSAFADSKATGDKGQSYSVMVDSGIYVWSLAAEQKHQEYLVWTRNLKLMRIAVVAVSLMILLVYINLTWRAKGRRFWRTSGIVTAETLLSVFVFGFLVFPTFVRSCYQIAVTRLRTPELTKDYITLITKYHDRGVIGDKAYEKIIKTIEKEPI